MLSFLGIFEIDRDILLYVQDNIRSGFLDKIFPNITHLGDAGVFWLILTAVLLCFKKTRKAGVFSLGALVGSVLINNAILKNAIGRTRPYELIDSLKLIGSVVPVRPHGGELRVLHGNPAEREEALVGSAHSHGSSDLVFQNLYRNPLSVRCCRRFRERCDSRYRGKCDREQGHYPVGEEEGAGRGSRGAG